MATLMPLLKDEPDNPDYLGMAADVELSLYVSQRSYLNHVSNERTLAFLERLLAVDVNDRARIYRKISQVYAVDRDYVTSLRYLEQAAEYSAQGGKHDANADALWVEAAQMAIEIEDFGKAHSYLLKALAQNPLNPTARQLSRELPMLSILPF
jgi:tetratricopeptide (TPR) repeat protein